MRNLTATEVAERHNSAVAKAAAAPGPGHNSNGKDSLANFVERLETLEQEKKSYADDIREVYAEAKGRGFDVKALRTIIKMRKQDADERREQEEIVSTYANALGMLL